MSQRLGRNPFERRPDAASAPQIPIPSTEQVDEREMPSALRWLLVEVPAQAYLLGLKSYLLMRSLIVLVLIMTAALA